jgi:ribosomal-protein-alanine N-acetyltransferase
MPNSPKRKAVNITNIKKVTALHQLHNTCLPEENWSKKSTADTLQNENIITIIASDDVGEIGFAIYSEVLDEIEIISIGVIPQQRNNGYGKSILENILSKNAGKKILLEVAEDNIAAVRFYESFGFSVNGRRKEYYSRKNGTKIDALLMVLN